MSDQENGSQEEPKWLELKLPHLLYNETAKELHTTIQSEWDYTLWRHVIHDPLADLLAGETYLKNFHEKIKNDCLKNAQDISGVLLAIRNLWAYRLSCLKESSVFEVDFSEVFEVKAILLEAAMGSIDEYKHPKMIAKSLNRVAAGIRNNDRLKKLQISGFVSEKNTVWVPEGILYYLSHSHPMQVLKIIAEKCALAHTVLLADFMHKPSTTLSSSIFHFYCNSPDHLLPSLGFSHVKLSQTGDPDAHFGLLDNLLNLFNTLCILPRSMQTHPENGKPCCHLYLVQASSVPNQEKESFENIADITSSSPQI
ncbi:hypothetical protein P3X46_002137 [Hevea brasiliensis]|uniref:Uncharacterized protein n=1 Tax=Hevea brasiliensis TaxID=3981 RepID=A0ABQ9N3R1_HEVBR|nr:hypothetical protein P3X46_002137 [Hevea brasiliensis]